MKSINLEEEFYNNLEKSDSSNIFISDCFLSSLSFDKIKAPISNANAKKSISFGFSGIRERAFGMEFKYLDNGINITTFCNLSMNSLNSCSDKCVFLNMSDLFLCNSSNANFGEYKSCSASKSFFIRDPFQKNENKTLVSNTNFIYSMPCDLSWFSLFTLTNLLNSNASFSQNSLFSSFVSKNSANSNLRNNLIAAFLNTRAQSISGCDSISIFNSLGNKIFISVMGNKGYNNYINFSKTGGKS